MSYISVNTLPENGARQFAKAKQRLAHPLLLGLVSERPSIDSQRLLPVQVAPLGYCGLWDMRPGGVWT